MDRIVFYRQWPSPLGKLLLTSDGKALVWALGDQVIVWDLVTARVRHTLKGHRRDVLAHPNPHLAPAKERFEPPKDRADQVLQEHRLLGGSHGSRSHPRQVHQVGHEAVQTLRLLKDRL